jgi:transposase
MLAPLLKALAETGHDMGFRLLADKAYSHSSTRTFPRDNRIKHTAPERSDQIAYGKTKGSKGARRVRRRKYKHRKTVERSFNRFKQGRRPATPLRQVRHDLLRRRPP